MRARHRAVGGMRGTRSTSRAAGIRIDRSIGGVEDSSKRAFTRCEPLMYCSEPISGRISTAAIQMLPAVARSIGREG